MLAACSDTGKGRGSGAAQGARSHSQVLIADSKSLAGRGDRDADEGRGHYYDPDDDPMLNFGHPLSTGALQQIASLLTRYYAAAVPAHGAAVCNLLYSVFAESIVEDEGEGGDATASGGSCGVILTKIFKKNHAQLAQESTKASVIAARVEHRRGYAFLDAGVGYPLMMYIHEESGAWKLESVLAQELG